MSELDKKIEEFTTKINNIVNPTPKNFDHYNKINKWRENNLLYEGRNYKHYFTTGRRNSQVSR